MMPDPTKLIPEPVEGPRETGPLSLSTGPTKLGP
jgi:hypothetical protein